MDMACAGESHMCVYEYAQSCQQYTYVRIHDISRTVLQSLTAASIRTAAGAPARMHMRSSRWPNYKRRTGHAVYVIFCTRWAEATPQPCGYLGTQCMHACPSHP